MKEVEGARMGDRKTARGDEGTYDRLNVWTGLAYSNCINRTSLIKEEPSLKGVGLEALISLPQPAYGLRPPSPQP